MINSTAFHLRTALLGLLALALGISTSHAQRPYQPSSDEIFHSIERLSVLGSVLYVAAHPDDENTRLISYMANERNYRTAYLSLTRGDGGQNLIGPEIRELLGVLRTQELLMARSVDGGEQMFARANDFGYSKNPEETMAIWEEGEVLADVVWAIRKFQPDVIINRFSHDSGRRTHGHHTASAMLSHEAFDMTADKSVFKEQLRYVQPWQASRLFFNTSWWFYGSREKFAEADKSDMVSVDAGVYYPHKGLSNTEIAARSRSMHRCQGFGSTGTRGEQLEYLQLLKQSEDMPGLNSDGGDPFDGINTTWTRVKNGGPIGMKLKEIERNFDAQNPSASLPALTEVHRMISGLDESYWREVKLTELEAVITACLGFYFEVVADKQTVAPGAEMSLDFELINRSAADLQFGGIEVYGDWNALKSSAPVRSFVSLYDTAYEQRLSDNQPLNFSASIKIPNNAPYTNAYWLNEKASLGMYRVPDQQMRGLPESPRALKVKGSFVLNGRRLVYERDIVYKENDPVLGEVYSPVEITPPVFAQLGEGVYLFADDKSQEVILKVSALNGGSKGSVKLSGPAGWTIEEPERNFDIPLDNGEQRFKFKVTPPATQSVGDLQATIQFDGQAYNRERILIDYEHVPMQTVLRPASSRIVRVDLEKRGSRIGYIMGAGDDIPACLEQVGYQVDLLDPETMNADDLQGYDAVITGIRAFNTIDRMPNLHDMLMTFVSEGGNMIVQYNTSHRLKTKDIGPYPLTLSRDRVTVEEAEVRIIAPEHPALNSPNKITTADFDGWVQERGLYFPNEWDDAYTPLLSSNDPGEPELEGGLLVAAYGEGYFVYTGYSWFRELPAGVPGAYRLFTNLISLGK